MREREGKREGAKEATLVTVELLRDIGWEDAEIKTILVKKYGLTAEEADEYMREKV